MKYLADCSRMGWFPVALTLVTACGGDLVTPNAPFCSETNPIPVNASLKTLIRGDALEAPIIRDLAIGFDSTVFVLDAFLRKVTQFDAHGNMLHQFGQEGPGPGELSEPHGVAIGPDGHIFVADNARIHHFDGKGLFIESISTPVTAVSVTVEPGGDVVVGSSVTRLDPRPRPYVARYSRDSKTWSPLIDVDSSDYGERPFIAMFNEVILINRSDDRVAVVYPFDRSVTVIKHGEASLNLKGCLDRGLRKRYEQEATSLQRKAASREPITQKNYYLVSGVHFAANGDVYFAHSDRIRGVGRITRFRSDGTPLATYEFEAPTAMHLGNRLSFWRAPNVLLSWNYYGDRVDVWHVDLPE